VPVPSSPAGNGTIVEYSKSHASILENKQPLADTALEPLKKSMRARPKGSNFQNNLTASSKMFLGI
jgi:hypothetical protein